MKNLYYFKQIFISLIAFLILSWAFWQNEFLIKIVISPFLICSIAIFFEYLFLFFNKKKISTIFQYIFRLSFFVYIIGFLIYTTYYAFVNKSYSLLIIVAIFLPVSIHFLRSIFRR